MGTSYWLEDDVSLDNDLPGIESRRSPRTEGGVGVAPRLRVEGDRVVHSIVVGVVEGVGGIDVKIKAHTLRQRNPLDEREVHVLNSRRPQESIRQRRRAAGVRISHDRAVWQRQ